MRRFREFVFPGCSILPKQAGANKDWSHSRGPDTESTTAVLHFMESFVPGEHQFAKVFLPSWNLFGIRFRGHTCARPSKSPSRNRRENVIPLCPLLNTPFSRQYGAGLLEGVMACIRLPHQIVESDTVTQEGKWSTTIEENTTWPARRNTPVGDVNDSE
jgi:hypothetical protein